MSVAGIIWISLVKGASNVNQTAADLSEDLNYYKTLSVLFALSVGFINAFITVQAKLMHKRMKLDVLDLTADTSLIYGIIQFLFMLFYHFHGHASIESHNFMIMVCSSILMAMCGFVA